MRSLLLLVSLSLMLVAPLQADDGQFTDIHGNVISLSELRGKWVVVNYWASWCPPCLDELPELEAFHQNHREDTAVVIGINVEQELTREELADFVAGLSLSFPIIRLQEGLPGFGPVPGLPTTFLIDPQGEIAARQVGAVSAAMIEGFMARY